MPSLVKLPPRASEPNAAPPADVSADAAAPAYTVEAAASAPESAALPPSFSPFPTTHKIGSQLTAPLVSVAALKAHLALLGAFEALQKTVEGLDGTVVVQDPKARWGVFVAVAVGRFDTFLAKCGELAGTGGVQALESSMVPIDVALVWHSYALNPRWYQEDAARNLPILQSLGGFPLDAYVETLDSETLAPRPSSSQLSTWEALTGLAFDPVASFVSTVTNGRDIVDPSSGQTVRVPYVTEDGKGYAQLGFEYTLDNGFRLTHEVLGVGKLVRDVQRVPIDKRATLAGTLFAPNEVAHPSISAKRVTLVRGQIIVTKSLQEPDLRSLGNAFEWSHDGARRMLLGVIRQPRALNNMLNAYTRGEPFGLDLTTAVLRQGTFVKKMTDLGWTIPHRFDGVEEETLQRCIARLHAFYDLAQSSPGTFFVPTLDIDLAWHTHQLDAFRYKEDCWKFQGQFMDHNDKVEESALSTSFDITARAWKSRFNVPYSTCGCPLPSDPGLSKFASKLGLKKAPPSSPLVPTSLSSTSSEATHASEHNSIYVTNSAQSVASRAKREKELKARRERDAKLVEKGKLPREVLDRQYAHDAAFLYPVPLYAYGLYGYPIGFGAYGAGGCAAVSGGYVDGNGGGGAGMGGCGVGMGACGGGVGCPFDDNRALVRPVVVRQERPVEVAGAEAVEAAVEAEEVAAEAAEEDAEEEEVAEDPELPE